MASFRAELAPEPVSETACPECALPLKGKFCHACGARVVDHHEYTLRHFFSHLLHEVTHFDSKIFGTLRVFATEPGQMVADYLAGRRRRYVPPLRFFLIVFALYLFLFTAFPQTAVYTTGIFHQASKSPINQKMTQALSKGTPQDSEAVIQRAIEKIAKKRHTTPEAIQEQLNERIHTGADVLQFGEVFTVALCMALLFRSRKRYFVEHLIFALNIVTFMLCLGILAWPYYMWHGSINAQAPAILLSGTLTLSYLYFAAKRVYGGTRGKLVLQTAGMFVGIQLSKMFFLMLTFVIAFLSLIPR
jgi:Protein of unknown function (DUF3667)